MSRLPGTWHAIIDRPETPIWLITSSCSPLAVRRTQVGFAEDLFFLLAHIMAGNGTMPPAIDEAGAFLLATSSTLSLVGDLGIIIAFASSSEARRLTTTRMIAFLAMADLVGEVGVRASRAQQPCPFLFFHR